MTLKIKRLLLVNRFSELFSIKKIRELCVHYKEIILYIIFGVVTTAVNWIVYSLMVHLLNVDLSGFSTDTVVFALFGDGDFHAFIAANSKELGALFIANFTAWTAGVVVAFVTNKLWVFESRIKTAGGILKELMLFTASRLITGVIEWFGLPLVIILGLNQTLFGVEGFLAKILISILVVILNYIFSKLIVFKKKKGKTV